MLIFNVSFFIPPYFFSWLCCYMCQMNPLIGPVLNQRALFAVKKFWVRSFHPDKSQILLLCLLLWSRFRIYKCPVLRLYQPQYFKLLTVRVCGEGLGVRKRQEVVKVTILKDPWVSTIQILGSTENILSFKYPQGKKVEFLPFNFHLVTRSNETYR